MSIAIIYPNRDASDWVAALLAHDPGLTVEVWPEISDPGRVEYVLCWNHPEGVLRGFPRLKCVSSLGAGVNHLLNDVTCPPDIPLVRLVDIGLKQSMAEYVMLGVLEHFRRFAEYRLQQRRGEWIPQPVPPISTTGIGLMGCGEIGRYVAEKLTAFGFTVHGWSRRPQQVCGVNLFAGKDNLGAFLANSDILVCLLPLTAETQGILNAETFSRLPRNAYLINAARGAHLVDADLLSVVDSGHLSGALLDVFREEPLPKKHPFWKHAKITITPHIASVTNPRSAALQVVENYHRAVQGERLSNLIDRQQGY
jgi:glyoxylate/hydroxypyruvate reductase A